MISPLTSLSPYPKEIPTNYCAEKYVLPHTLKLLKSPPSLKTPSL